jgi:Fic family protein
MLWNWELANWPHFTYDPSSIALQERRFLLELGGASAFLKNIDQDDRHHFIVEILTEEGSDSSKIEGEILDRESLQSSIKRHFGLNTPARRQGKKKEEGMAGLVCDVYETFQQPLTHEMLWTWHSLLFGTQVQPKDWGRYRIHEEPMQIVSGRYDRPAVFFEAPPSSKIPEEMDRFIDWYNSIDASMPVLGRAALAHVYFESIHPFEDGNGRIGRALVEKILSQSIGRPVLVAVSRVLEERKKEYYAALERCNRTLEADPWVQFFATATLEASRNSISLLNFLVAKSKMFVQLGDLLNPRQEKALLRLFDCSPVGFKGGLSADNYISITKTSRATATRDLSELVEMGALRKTGELRHTRYWLNI